MKNLRSIIILTAALFTIACTSEDFNTDPMYDAVYGASNRDGGAKGQGQTVSFKEFCLKNFDFDSDGSISKSELTKVTVLDCSSQGFSDLDLIVYFTNLDTLRCAHNKLKELDLSNNKKLRFLDCSYNYLEKLDVSATNVSTLYCAPMNDDSGNNLLKYLFIYRGQSIEAVTYAKDAYKDKRIPDETQIISVPASKDGDTENDKSKKD